MHDNSENVLSYLFSWDNVPGNESNNFSKYLKNDLEIDNDTLQALMKYRWPGNVRELRNAIESLVIFARNSTIGLLDLPEEIRQDAASAPSLDLEVPENIPADPDNQLDLPVGMTMADAEREIIMRTLESCDGNRTTTAKVLGIGLRTLQRKLKEYGEA